MILGGGEKPGLRRAWGAGASRGLASELRRTGVPVRTVSDKLQAADHELKRQVKHSVACGIDWTVLVSDDEFRLDWDTSDLDDVLEEPVCLGLGRYPHLPTEIACYMMQVHKDSIKDTLLSRSI